MAIVVSLRQLRQLPGGRFRDRSLVGPSGPSVVHEPNRVEWSSSVGALADATRTLLHHSLSQGLFEPRTQPMGRRVGQTTWWSRRSSRKPSLAVEALTADKLANAAALGAGERRQVKGSDPYVESLIGVCHSKGLLGQRPGPLQTTSSHLFSRTESSRRLRRLVASLLARRSLVSLICFETPKSLTRSAGGLQSALATVFHRTLASSGTAAIEVATLLCRRGRTPDGCWTCFCTSAGGHVESAVLVEDIGAEIRPSS